MAHFLCNCGEDLWNGRVPNEIEIRIFREETWRDAVKQHNDIYLLREDYDIWKCPKCGRVRSFKKNNLDKVFQIEEFLTEDKNKCLCGKDTEFSHYIAYTDIEMDEFTYRIETITEMRKAPRTLRSCNHCNRFFLKEENSELVVVYKESNK